MNDFWNDPPDYDDTPECCGNLMDISDDGICSCPQCGHTLAMQPDIEPIEEPDYSEVDWQNHYAIPIRSWTDDDYHRADIEFDAARDRQFEK